MIDAIVNIAKFDKSDTEKETYESIEQFKLPEDKNDGDIILPYDLNEKEMIDPSVVAMFKRSRHNILGPFIISQSYYELQKKPSELRVIFITS